MKPRGDCSCPSPLLTDSLMWVAVFGTTARVSPTCPRMCVSQLVLAGGGGGEKATHTVSCSPTKHFLSEGTLASLPTLCCYLFIFLWPPPPPVPFLLGPHSWVFVSAWYFRNFGRGRPGGVGRSRSWGQGRGWSLGGSEVRPAPFS